MEYSVVPRRDDRRKTSNKASREVAICEHVEATSDLCSQYLKNPSPRAAQRSQKGVLIQ
jgi:hypothetical protein